MADSFYGRSHAFREWLEERGRPYAVMVPKTNAVPLRGRKEKIEQYVERLAEDAFSEVHSAQDELGLRRPWEWASVDLAPDPEKKMRRWLLVRRSTDDPEDHSFYQAYGPEDTTIEELVGVCQDRWAVEQCFAEAKGEVGMDHLLAMAAPEGRRSFLLGWSVWRRAHQTLAARCRAVRCRAAKRAARQALGTGGSLKVATIPSEGARLTEEQWELVRPLLPSQRGGIGRPPNDHRVVLGGILWVARTGCSWREMPEEYGDFTTAYRRWRAWKERGLWQRILEALGWEELPGPATKPRK